MKSDNKKKFCIVDPELLDTVNVGHCLSYDLMVAGIVQQRGYQPLILAHNKIGTNLYNNILIKPVITRRLWEVTAEEFLARFNKPNIRGLLRLVYLLTRVCFVRVIFSNFSVSEKIWIIKKLSFWISFEILHFRNLKIRIYHTIKNRFFNELKAGFNPFEEKNDSIIFAQHTCGPQLFGWARYALESAAISGPKIMIILRYDSKYYIKYNSAFRLLEPFIKLGYVSILTDSNRLANDYRRLVRSTITVIPIPYQFNKDYFLQLSQKQNSNKIVIGSLGAARLDKGFLRIVEAVKILSKLNTKHTFIFIIQINHLSDPHIQNAIKELEKIDNDKIELIYNPMPSDVYFRKLIEIDILLMPYISNDYRSRTSGVLVEAMCAGKICVVTKNTWMSDELCQWGFGLYFDEQFENSLVNCIIDIDNNYEVYKKEALLAVPRSLEWHNENTYFDKIMNSWDQP